LRIGRTIPPAAAPLTWRSILDGLAGWIRADEEVRRFERELKHYFRKKHCFLVSSGKAALTLILQSLSEQCPNRDKVLIPAYTCYSVPSAITKAGLKVMLCDVAEGSFDYDFEKLRPLLADKRLLCVISQHLYGVPADIERLREMIGPLPIGIVEDAAQAMGGRRSETKLGTLGDAGFFSLGRGKAFSTVEGGVIVTDRAELAQIIERRHEKLPAYSLGEICTLFIYALALRVLMHPLLFWLPQGVPFLRLGETIYDPKFKIRKMSAFQGGMARGWSERLAEFGERRRRNAEYWQRLETDGGFRLDFTHNGENPDLLRFPLETLDRTMRDWLSEKGSEIGLGIAPGYPDSIDHIKELRNHFSGQTYPQARGLAERLVTLPVHPLLSAKDRERIEDLLDRSQGAPLCHK
jgi:perosamine synthetase